MLHRQDEEGIIAISQPAHAWVSGQLAWHWGNNLFPEFGEEVCLAAEQHDIGFLDWDMAPTWNPKTGLPYSFLDMPPRTHFEIWTAGVRKMMRLGRYPALLVSLHYTGLARKGSSSQDQDAENLAANFISEQEELQTTLMISLQNDFYYGPSSADETIERNREMISLWDWMSLLLCLGFKEEKRIPGVPGTHGQVELGMVALDGGKRITIQPWPFRNSRIELICEGRRLLKTYRSEEEMRAMLRAAAPITIPMELVKG
jgi:hypothetical protein